MLLGKSEGVLAGVPFAGYVFEYLGCTVEWLKPEGHLITKEEAERKAAVAKVSGPTNRLLQAERTALNILSRASGVATASRAAMEIARAHGWHGRVAGTRKTTPGFGIVEKCVDKRGERRRGGAEEGREGRGRDCGARCARGESRMHEMREAMEVRRDGMGQQGMNGGVREA